MGGGGAEKVWVGVVEAEGVGDEVVVEAGDGIVVVGGLGGV